MMGAYDIGEEEWQGVDYMPDLPPGHDHVFTFSKNKGYTYLAVLHQHTSFATWAMRQPKPGRELAHFVDWVIRYYNIHEDTLEVSRSNKDCLKLGSPLGTHPKFGSIFYQS